MWERISALLVWLDGKADYCAREEGVGVMNSPEGGNADVVTEKRHARRRNGSWVGSKNSGPRSK
jgi:hypothetical protein